MELLIDIAQYLFMLIGIVSILVSITQYSRRTSDISGAFMLFVKRIEMSVNEYKWYRIGISVLILGVAIRIIKLTLWG
ncbi:hypothetical protein [Aliivibrio fischeri]|uniref:Uncharacterized protein n=1 Tax=Aliivibrio fischeri (strain MJ11) TaxID=388396 RepID=B5EU06_ALIFM|nr:hypothetical protein [Aliivibrio fischeri]ACH64042.1 conserved hypothetical protein [Aliivibrio fischeri MJ11]MUH97321.1 hypothetical protein [Aliivibrio fischeri]MUI64934.1 hypothetical protein [Aliivibrio fischeri]OCH05022.1 hypothetical protein A6E10_10920 [Aliivibrio fischeri]OCH31153.1 hypothetical protein A6E13_17660 [Aliivibrio fischeri]